MLELTLAGLVGFAAIVAYAIVGDRTQSNTQKTAAEKKADPKPAQLKAAPSNKPDTGTDKPKPVQKRNPTTKPAKPKEDPIDQAAAIIKEHVLAKGPITLNKLSQELKLPKETVELAAQRLVAAKALAEVNRGGYPGLARI